MPLPSRGIGINRIFDEEAIFFVRLLASTDLQAFLIEHGLDPIAPSSTPFFEVTSVYEEEIHSPDPFEARFTFIISGDYLVVAVGDDLNFVDRTLW